MIGCMVCRKEANRYGAMSGEDSTQGFKDAVEGLGWIPCNEAVAKEEFSAMNPRINAGNSTSLDDAWKTCVDNNAGGPGNAAARDRGESWNKPGVCAAAKLIGRSKQKGPGNPHNPKMMTEEWFDPVRRTTVKLTYPLVDNSLRGLWQRLLNFCYGRINFRRVPGTFEDAATVPSCNTCQTLVPFLSCDNRKECG
jgi:hypothetical protein